MNEVMCQVTYKVRRNVIAKQIEVVAFADLPFGTIGTFSVRTPGVSQTTAHGGADAGSRGIRDAPARGTTPTGSVDPLRHRRPASRQAGPNHSPCGGRSCRIMPIGRQLGDQSSHSGFMAETLEEGGLARLLCDAPGRGRKSQKEGRLHDLMNLLATVRADGRPWTIRRLADASRMSVASVHRLLRQNGLSVRRENTSLAASPGSGPRRLAPRDPCGQL